MSKFISYLLEEATEKKDFGKTIAIVAGSMKPPHAGHWDMVQQYAEKADEVIVLISDPKSQKSIRKTALGTTITPQMSKEIFELYIKKYGLSSKVKVEVSKEPSPITAMFKYVDDNLKDVNVIFGVSKKGGDESRFKSAMKYYADNEHINLLDPMTTAVEPYKSADGKEISATDLRDNIDNPAFVKSMLPDKLSASDVQKVLDILGTSKAKVDESDEPRDSLDPLDETECVNISISDQDLSSSKILCYNAGQTVVDDKGKEQPVNPKKFPDKAIDIVCQFQGLPVEIWFNPLNMCWDSHLLYNGIEGKLSPEQFGQFFNSMFYMKLLEKVRKLWPLSDKYHADLYQGLMAKQMQVGPELPLTEDADEDKDVEKRTHTASGRKIVHFSDQNVSKKDAKFFCWPNTKALYRWSTWKDWKKIRPLCRIRFKHGKITYGISLSAINDDYKNRGFKAYDITTLPHLQWLSKEETHDIMKLSIVDKFIRHCIKKIEDALKLDPEDIYKNINNPEKITVDEIKKTMSVVRKTLNEIIKPKQTDSFKWGN